MEQLLLKKITECGLFAELAPESIDQLLESWGCSAQYYRAGEAVLSEGEKAGRVGLVLSGSVNVEKHDIYGNCGIFATLGEGELFAEAFAFSGVPLMSVTVKAAEDCAVLMMNGSDVLSEPELAASMVKLIAKKTFRFDQRIEVISQRRTRDKLLTYLQQQADMSGSDSFVIPYDRQGLADYLGVERSGLSVELNRLVREGLITAEGPSFTICREKTALVKGGKGL